MKVRESKKLHEIPVKLHLAGLIMSGRMQESDVHYDSENDLKRAASDAIEAATILLLVFNEED